MSRFTDRETSFDFQTVVSFQNWLHVSPLRLLKSVWLLAMYVSRYLKLSTTSRYVFPQSY